MPELFCWALMGYMIWSGFPDMGLFLLTLFDTYLRPGSLLLLAADEVVAPEKVTGHHVLVVAPVEKEVSTKTGVFDEAVVLDGSLCPELGILLKELAARRIALSKADRCRSPESTLLWGFSARDFNKLFVAGVHDLRLPEMESCYQARHGGACRDSLVGSRSKLEIQLRANWSTNASFRIYNKPGRVQQLVEKGDKNVLTFAGLVRDNFSRYIRSGRCPKLPIAV
jgi:hypothetical protein